MTGPVIERLAEQPEVCRASIEAASYIARPLLAELSNSASVLYTVASVRMSGLPILDRLSLAPLLHPDPSRSGAVVERYRLQTGELPKDATDDVTPEQAVAIWAANVAAVPRLTVPEGTEVAVMNLADRMQMRGGGPVVFAREQVGEMEHLPNTLLQVTGAANNANRERIDSALAYAEAHGIEQPIVATVNPLRVLQEKERQTVKGFAPEATNELELFVDSAIDRGFIAPAGDRYGVRFLPDGSAYLKMQHENGAELVVLAPVQHLQADGKKQTGVFNAYQALSNHPEVVSSNFKFEGSNVIHVTSSHYGPMAVMNNLRAVDEMRTSISSFRVIGDNQAARTAQAHLIEVGLTTDGLLQATERPRIAAALQEALAA